MRKGFISEVLVFVIVSIAVLVLVLFFTAETTLKGGAVKGTISSREAREAAHNAISTLYNSRLEGVQKSYAELMIDAAQKENRTRVFYGKSIGVVIVPEAVNPLMDTYFGKGRWEIRVITPRGESEYGSLKEKEKYHYVYKVPSPKEKIGKLILNVG